MNAHTEITAPLKTGIKTHSDAATALEAALKDLREAARDYAALVNTAATKLDVAVDAFNAPAARRHGPRCPLNARHAISARRPVQSGMAGPDSVQRPFKRLARPRL